ncbi:MAG: HAD-IB family hydrolase [Patescibacteria group bacterium]|jgi:HAD superfamily hydrolase (TIGR01490 family)
MAIAFFDIDHTIVSSISAEKIFFSYLTKKRRIPLINYFRVATFFLENILFNPYKATLQNKQYLANQNKDEVIKWGKECFYAEIKKKMPKSALLAVTAHKKKGDKIILLSGNLFFLAELIKDYVGADDIVCTQLETKENLFTGKIIGLHAYKEAKRTLLKEYIKKHHLEKQEIYCYANSIADLPFLECADHPIAVNPSWHLKKEALARNWPVVFYT